jgi:hypothetical protein
MLVPTTTLLLALAAATPTAPGNWTLHSGSYLEYDTGRGRG